MILNWPKKTTTAPATKEPETRTLYATDDLIQRAENIVWVLGYRGAVGNQVLDVYDLLKKYEQLDLTSPAKGSQ